MSVKSLSSDHLQWGLFASVSKVIISGASEDFVRTIVEFCPNVKTLQIDGILATVPATHHLKNGHGQYYSDAVGGNLSRQGVWVVDVASPFKALIR